MIIRPAYVEDAPAMGQTMVAAFLAAHKGQILEAQWRRRQEEWTPDVSARGWANTLQDMADGQSPDSCIFLACPSETNGDVIGLVMGGRAQGGPWPDAGEVYALYVKSERQGQGIGKALLGTAVSYLAHLGLTHLIIRCLATNLPARGFYEAYGGQKIGEIEKEDDGFVNIEWIYGWEDINSLLVS